MSDFIRDGGAGEDGGPQDPTTNFSYPWASAPDIIRSNQKDAYFQSQLLTHLSSVIRSLYGARTAHNWTNEARTFTELLYLSLTTFVGNRTLGEEYCDIVQVEDDTHRFPSITRRGGYILSSILLPYILTRLLPALRKRLRTKLETSLRKKQQRRASSPAPSSSSSSKSPTPLPTSRSQQLQEYTLKHLDTLTSPSPLYALSLATFYFTGAYYQLSKRLTGLRYIFTRKLEENEQRAGYEVLGVLLCLQMGVQGYLHFAETWRSVRSSNLPGSAVEMAGTGAVIDGGVEVGAVPNRGDGFGEPLLFEASQGRSDDNAARTQRLSKVMHTDLGKGVPGYDLEEEGVMEFISGKQQRKCTLCLEAMKDPAVTTCGHVFCWSCVGDWLREQPMCPLCRQAALVQHVLPLRG
ncbi:hypothetical protein MBLNU230_g8131t1 [Neophaeotheca triangularis]